MDKKALGIELDNKWNSREDHRRVEGVTRQIGQVIMQLLHRIKAKGASLYEWAYQHGGLRGLAGQADTEIKRAYFQFRKELDGFLKGLPTTDVNMFYQQYGQNPTDWSFIKMSSNKRASNLFQKRALHHTYPEKSEHSLLERGGEALSTGFTSTGDAIVDVLRLVGDVAEKGTGILSGLKHLLKPAGNLYYVLQNPTDVNTARKTLKGDHLATLETAVNNDLITPQGQLTPKGQKPLQPLQMAQRMGIKVASKMANALEGVPDSKEVVELADLRDHFETTLSKDKREPVADHKDDPATENYPEKQTTRVEERDQAPEFKESDKSGPCKSSSLTEQQKMCKSAALTPADADGTCWACGEPTPGQGALYCPECKEILSEDLGEEGPDERSSYGEDEAGQQPYDMEHPGHEASMEVTADTEGDISGEIIADPSMDYLIDTFGQDDAVLEKAIMDHFAPLYPGTDLGPIVKNIIQSLNSNPEVMDNSETLNAIHSETPSQG